MFVPISAARSVPDPSIYITQQVHTNLNGRAKEDSFILYAVHQARYHNMLGSTTISKSATITDAKKNQTVQVGWPKLVERYGLERANHLYEHGLLKSEPCPLSQRTEKEFRDYWIDKKCELEEVEKKSSIDSQIVPEGDANQTMADVEAVEHCNLQFASNNKTVDIQSNAQELQTEALEATVKEIENVKKKCWARKNNKPRTLQASKSIPSRFYVSGKH